MTDELDVFGGLGDACEQGNAPTGYLERLRAMIASFRAAEEGLARAREASAAFAEILQRVPGADAPLHELGRVMEALSMAQQLMDKGPR